MCRAAGPSCRSMIDDDRQREAETSAEGTEHELKARLARLFERFWVSSNLSDDGRNEPTDEADPTNGA